MFNCQYNIQLTYNIGERHDVVFGERQGFYFGQLS